MNVLFLSLGRYWSINDSDGYTDILREFIKNGDKVFIVSPTETREGKKTQVIEENNSSILKVKTGNIQKTNLIEKGISTILIEPQFLHAIKKYFFGVKFDLVLYPTPPITFVKVVEYVKKRDDAKTYLLLKDIFPQNAIDLGILRTTGLKGLIYKFFRRKEKKLYKISDRIGCMSKANVDYVIAHNPEVDPEIVEICPNAIEVVDKSESTEERNSIRIKYNIPIDKTVFVYGGNLGKPQSIPFLIECLNKCNDLGDVFFLIVGDGTEYHLLEEFIETIRPGNVRLLRRIPKDDYDILVGSCDVGLVFLDHRFSIPNFPSRILSYMQAKIPILAVTDTNSDLGSVITTSNSGWWCPSNNTNLFRETVETIILSDISSYGRNAFGYLKENYDSSNCYGIIKKTLGR